MPHTMVTLEKQFGKPLTHLGITLLRQRDPKQRCSSTSIGRSLIDDDEDDDDCDDEDDEKHTHVQRWKQHKSLKAGPKTQWLKGCSSLLSMVDGFEKVHESSCADEVKTQVTRRGYKFPSSWHPYQDGSVHEMVTLEKRLRHTHASPKVPQSTAFRALHVQSASPQKTSRDA